MVALAKTRTRLKRNIKKLEEQECHAAHLLKPLNDMQCKSPHHTDLDAGRRLPRWLLFTRDEFVFPNQLVCGCQRFMPFTG